MTATKRLRTAIVRPSTMLSLLTFLLMPAGIANAQHHGQESLAPASPAASVDAPTPAIKRLNYLVGSWIGARTENGPDGKPVSSQGKDTVTHVFGGRALIIDGVRGFVVISGDTDPDKIRIAGFGAGAVLNGEGTVDADGSAHWMMSSGMRILKFEVRPVAPDGWLEIGKMSGDAGETWHRFEVRFSREKR